MTEAIGRRRVAEEPRNAFSESLFVIRHLVDPVDSGDHRFTIMHGMWPDFLQVDVRCPDIGRLRILRIVLIHKAVAAGLYVPG